MVFGTTNDDVINATSREVCLHVKLADPKELSPLPYGLHSVLIRVFLSVLASELVFTIRGVVRVNLLDSSQTAHVRSMVSKRLYASFLTSDDY